MDQDERLDLVRRIFALLTGRLEDAATLAADGQGASISSSQAVELAERIRDECAGAAVIAEAAAALSIDLK
jgi:hypothetical protein